MDYNVHRWYRPATGVYAYWKKPSAGAIYKIGGRDPIVLNLLMYMQTLGCLRLLLVLIAFFCLNCREDLNERVVACPDGSSGEFVHSWGNTLTLRPAPGHEWLELLRDPYRNYGAPPVTAQDLERRYGVPTKTWFIEGRPFSEYRLPAAGILQLGLEEERSGSELDLFVLSRRSGLSKVSLRLQDRKFCEVVWLNLDQP